MNITKCILGVVITLCISPIYALSEKEILLIASKPHDTKNLKEEMKIFPTDGVYQASMKIDLPKGAPVDDTPASVLVKVVEGTYRVSRFRSGSDDKPIEIINITKFLEDENIYVRWIYIKKEKLIYEYRGVLLDKTNQIAWAMINPEKHGFDISLINEKYYKDKVVWSQRDYLDGRLAFSMEGTEKKHTK